MPTAQDYVDLGKQMIAGSGWPEERAEYWTTKTHILLAIQMFSNDLWPTMESLQEHNPTLYEGVQYALAELENL